MFHRYLIPAPTVYQPGDSLIFFLPRFPKAYERTVASCTANAAGHPELVVFTDGDTLKFTQLEASKTTAEYCSANRAFCSPVQSIRHQPVLAVAS